MRALCFVLGLFALVIFLVSALHLALGVQADAMLGAIVPASAVSDPSLDSQNRFYGMAFSLYGAVFYLCSTDLKRYGPALNAALLCFFLGGLARLVSWAAHGAPAPLVILLAASELLLPPVLFFWLRSVRSAA